MNAYTIIKDELRAGCGYPMSEGEGWSAEDNRMYFDWVAHLGLSKHEAENALMSEELALAFLPKLQGEVGLAEEESGGRIMEGTFRFVFNTEALVPAEEVSTPVYHQAEVHEAEEVEAENENTTETEEPVEEDAGEDPDDEVKDE